MRRLKCAEFVDKRVMSRIIAESETIETIEISGIGEKLLRNESLLVLKTSPHAFKIV